TTSPRSDDGSSPLIPLSNFVNKNWFICFQVNQNGHLTFNGAFSSYSPQRFPMYGTRDIIAVFWTDLDNRVNGEIYYNQYTSSSVLQQATQDINRYFPGLNFNANWVFVATWYEVAYYPTTGTRTTIQAVLISGGQYSFVLMNYGIIALTTHNAGYDTENSTHHFTIPGSFSNNATGIYSAFRLGSNVNVPGRWAFRIDLGSRGPLYPIAGTTSPRLDDGSSPLIPLQRPFVYFGRSYSQIYVNNNGHLTFNGAFSSFTPQRFPMYGTRDIITVFWTDLDNRVNGEIYYNQYTSGSVLQQATQDINRYFPGLNFNANWVFVATWYEVAYYPTTGTVSQLDHRGQERAPWQHSRCLDTTGQSVCQ
uniref:NIDO domain-containing protein n=1 Tax=Sander lucioperca TaxID=283035 RepID=A0A8C9YEB8_SANLU